jgi:hypothetical protein
VGNILGGCGSLLVDTPVWCHLIGHRHSAGSRFIQGTTLITAEIVHELQFHRRLLELGDPVWFFKKLEHMPCLDSIESREHQLKAMNISEGAN